MRGEPDVLFAPGAFLPSAERLGFIQAIDRWVVHHAIELIASQERIGHHLRLEVNLSGRSIGDPALTALIEHDLRASAIDPSSLIFEITETSAIANIDAAREFVNTITDLGCQFALDDFGTGFGSFYYLKNLPVQYLKIDGDFITALADNQTDRLMVRSITQLARGMGIKTIAEFVSDNQTQRLLSEYDVDMAQGFHIGHPLDVSTVWPAHRPPALA